MRALIICMISPAVANTFSILELTNWNKMLDGNCKLLHRRILRMFTFPEGASSPLVQRHILLYTFHLTYFIPNHTSSFVYLKQCSSFPLLVHRICFTQIGISIEHLCHSVFSTLDATEMKFIGYFKFKYKRVQKFRVKFAFI